MCFDLDLKAKCIHPSVMYYMYTYLKETQNGSPIINLYLQYIGTYIRKDTMYNIPTVIFLS